jgi:hypothetical protein
MTDPFYIELMTKEKRDPLTDTVAIEEILNRYAIIKNRIRYLRLRDVALARDESGSVIIELADLIDAIWDAASVKS